MIGADSEDFEESGRKKEVLWVFTGLLLWHLFLAVLKFRSWGDSVPAVTVLTLIQLSIIAYILGQWLCKAQQDSL